MIVIGFQPKGMKGMVVDFDLFLDNYINNTESVRQEESSIGVYNLYTSTFHFVSVPTETLTGRLVRNHAEAPGSCDNPENAL
jgi:hypothetical protein